jgi:hypothetical protein
VPVLIEPTSLILVAVLNNPRDFEIARLLGWYRIPLRFAPKVIAVDRLAFYQTAAFGDEKWRISYTAAVKGQELTTRKELLKEEPDHPRANHEYYKIQLGPLERLTTPIPASSWRRITFFYTTGEYLLAAHSVEDLVVRSQERQTFWRALRDRADEDRMSFGSEEITESLPEELSPEILSIFLGFKGLDLNEE